MSLYQTFKSIGTGISDFFTGENTLTQSQIDRNLYIYEGGEPNTDNWQTSGGFTYGYGGYEEEYVDDPITGESKSIFGGDSEFSADTPSSVSDTSSFMGYKLPASFKKLKGVIDDKSNPLGQQRRRTTKKTSPDRFSGRGSSISDPRKSRGNAGLARALELARNTKVVTAKINGRDIELKNMITSAISDSKATSPTKEKTIGLSDSESLRSKINVKTRIA